MRRLIECIKERTILNAPGYRTKSGPNGTTLEIDVKKKASSSPLPWSFSCAEDPETGERTGGWRNGRLQVGLECGWRSPDIDGLKPEDVEPEEGSEDETTFPYVTGCGQCEDADYYLEINISKNTAKVVASNEDSRLEPTDPRNNVVRVFLGTVTEGRLNEEAAIHMNPVIYKYL